jgi:TM2 domain-containing membrane protein YozV
VYGERTMANLVMDVVLFSWTFAFVTAVVIAAAKWLI